jgi:hypothetical protein
LMLFDSQSGRRFHQSPDEFAREWDGNAIVFSGSQDLPGVRLAQKEMERIYGACCGAQRGEDNLGCTDAMRVSRRTPSRAVQEIQTGSPRENPLLWRRRLVDYRGRGLHSVRPNGL